MKCLSPFDNIAQTQYLGTGANSQKRIDILQAQQGRESLPITRGLSGVPALHS